MAFFTWGSQIKVEHPMILKNGRPQRAMFLSSIRSPSWLVPGSSYIRWMGQRNPAPVENGGKHPIYPIIYRVSTCFNHPIGGAGFLLSTVRSRKHVTISQDAHRSTPCEKMKNI